MRIGAKWPLPTGVSDGITVPELFARGRRSGRAARGRARARGPQRSGGTGVFPAAQEFADAIEQALESADVVIVCWTESSVHSAWVRDEAGVGSGQGPARSRSTLDGCQPPLGFRQYHTIDLSRWNGRPQSPRTRSAQGCDRREGQREPRSQWWQHSRGGGPAYAAFGRAAGRARRRRSALICGRSIPLSALLAGPGNVEPKVAVGQFGLVSADLPRGLPNMVGQEIVAAFGAENAVTVIAPGDRKARSAPFVMDGSISPLGQAVRFTVNLKNQRTGVVLWSNAFEHEAADAVAARQAAVGASQVVRCGLWGASSYRKHMSDQALSLYFKWCNEHWSGSTSATAELDAARRVTVAVPDFSFGWSALALAAVPLAAAQSAEAKQLRSEAKAAARKSMDSIARIPKAIWHSRGCCRSIVTASARGF